MKFQFKKKDFPRYKYLHKTQAFYANIQVNSRHKLVNANSVFVSKYSVMLILVYIIPSIFIGAQFANIVHLETASMLNNHAQKTYKQIQLMTPQCLCYQSQILGNEHFPASYLKKNLLKVYDYKQLTDEVKRYAQLCHFCPEDTLFCSKFSLS